MKPVRKPDAIVSPAPTKRVAWVDVAKGLSILLVVMMHSTLGVQIATGGTSWMGQIVEFARPFRIPGFMLISGLFLHKTIDGDWRRFIDRKIIHFFYFYLLWVAIQVVIKTPVWMNEGNSGAQIISIYLMTFIQPFGTLWFIYLLPVFYLVTRLARNIPWPWVFAIAMALQILPIHTGSTLIDEFASRYIYFFIGYVFYRHLFNWATFAGNQPIAALAIFLVWLVLNIALFDRFAEIGFYGSIKLVDLPLISLSLGVTGAMMMIAAGALITKVRWLGFMNWVGEHSIVIYLAFFLPMGVSRIVLLKYAGEALSTNTIAILVTLSASVGPIVFYLLVKKTGFGMFLFERPALARLK